MAKWEARTSDPKMANILIDQFLTPTLKTAGASKPVITQHYADTFNPVDRFNRLCADVAFCGRKEGLYFTLLVGLVEVALVQTFIVRNDWLELQNEEQQTAFLRKYASDLANELLQ